MKRCPHCNRKYEDSQAFCLDDGTPLTTAESAPDSTQTQVLPRRGKTKFLPVLAAVLLLLMAASVGWFVLASRENGVNQNSKQTAVNQQTPIPTFSPVQTPPIENPIPTPEATNPAEINSNISTNSEVKTETVSNSRLTDEVNSAKTPQLTQQAPIMKAEDHQIAFALQQCRKSGTSITCDFLLTNKGQDRWFKLVAFRSHLFDELGNGYEGKNAQLANQQGSEPRIAFIAGVTTRAQITFEEIDPNASKITLLQIQYDAGDDYALQMKFRNVPLIISK